MIKNGNCKAILDISITKTQLQGRLIKINKAEFSTVNQKVLKKSVTKIEQELDNEVNTVFA